MAKAKKTAIKSTAPMAPFSVLMFGDSHAKFTGPIPAWNRIDGTGMTEELRRYIKSMEFMVDIIGSIKPDVVVFFGDLYHSIYSIDVPTLVHVQRSMTAVYNAAHESEAEFWVVRGNHDTHSAGVSSVEVIKYDRLFQETKALRFDNGLRIGIVPYRDPEEVMHDDILSIQDKVDVIFTHCSFAGGFMNSNRISSGMDAGLIKKPLFSGHFHIPQDIGNVHYVGSVYQNLPSEHSPDVPHGALLWESSTGSIGRIVNGMVKRMVTVRDFDSITDYSPKEYFIKAVVSDSNYKEVKEYLEKKKYEFMVVKLPDADKARRVVKIEVSSPKDMILDYIKVNHPHLDEYIRRVI